MLGSPSRSTRRLPREGNTFSQSTQLACGNPPLYTAFKAKGSAGVRHFTDDESCNKKEFFFKLWQGEKPSVCRDNPSLIVLRRKPALEAKSLPDCHLSAALSIPVKDPKVALVCREITPWPCSARARKAAQCAGCCQYHSCFIFYFI